MLAKIPWWLDSLGHRSAPQQAPVVYPEIAYDLAIRLHMGHAAGNLTRRCSDTARRANSSSNLLELVARAPGDVVKTLMRHLSAERTRSASVVALMLKVCPRAIAPSVGVSDQSRRRCPDVDSMLDHSPYIIVVIARSEVSAGAQLFIERPYRLYRAPTKGKVAPDDINSGYCPLVSCGPVDDLLWMDGRTEPESPLGARRSDEQAADQPDGWLGHESCNELLEPARVRLAVVVGERNNLPLRLGDGGVAGSAEPAARVAHNAHGVTGRRLRHGLLHIVHV
jgi:hypothetical protein